LLSNEGKKKKPLGIYTHTTNKMSSRKHHNVVNEEVEENKITCQHLQFCPTKSYPTCTPYILIY